MLKQFFGAAGVRIALLPLSGIASLLVARFISSTLGAEQYAAFALVAALPLLVPFSDLGLGAALTNAAARLPSEVDEFVSVLRRAQRVLWIVAAIFSAIVIALGVTGLWPMALGLERQSSAQELNLGVTIALLIFSVSVPAGLGARILVGLRRNTLVVAVQTSTALITLAAVAATLPLGMSLGVILPATTIGLASTNWLLYLIARGVAPVKEALASSTRHLRVGLWHTAVPMLLMSVLLPVTFQSERLVVSIVAGAHQLAIYSAAVLLFLPALSVLQTSTRSLWGEFASARAQGRELRPMLVRALLASTGLGVLTGGGFLLVAPVISEWAVKFQIKLPMSLMVILAFLLLAHSIHLPSGMLLTDSRGLRAQAICAAVAAVIALPTSIWLAHMFGAPGPPLATLASLVCAQLIPLLILAWRRSKGGFSPNDWSDGKGRHATVRS